MAKDLKNIRNYINQKYEVNMSIKTQKPEYSEARCLYVLLSQRLTNFCNTKIASVINRDRSTISTIRKTADDLFDTCQSFKTRYYDVLEHFKHFIPFDQRIELSEYFKLKSESFKTTL